MPRHHKPGSRSIALRSTAVLSALGLAVGLAVAMPDQRALAAADVHADEQDSALDPGIVGHLPHDLTFTLSPELAQMFGRSAVNADEAMDLLATRGTSLNAAMPGLVPAETPAVGTKRLWPALDASGNTPTALPAVGIFLKEYTLSGKRDNIEVWVASGADEISTGTAFPEGDCRATKADPTVVTPAQAQFLADEFQEKQLPKETKFFSVAPSRNGTASIGQLGPLGLDFRGGGDSTVALIDNVRDPNFYDFENNRTYIAGFFAPIFNVLTDRNVMTIDAFDWLHRTGKNPKNEPDDDICQSRPARPQLYESVFAHEYQHLLMSYTDPGETIWINEGLSDMAPFFVGYADPKRSIKQTRAESHIYCFQGYGETKGPSNPNPNACGGPENSLTAWEDQGGGSDVLADYGNAWSFLLYLFDRYGAELISALHRDGMRQGLPSVQAALDDVAPGTKVQDLVHDFQLTNLLDNIASDPAVDVAGVKRSAITTDSLRAEINYRVDEAYLRPGASPNGADYVVLRKGGEDLAGSALRSLVFAGAPTVVSNDEEVAVENWKLRLVGLDSAGKSRVLVKTFDSAFNLTLAAKALGAFDGFDTVIAVVSHDDTQELLSAYAPYALTVNGALQKGGS
ncbi:MAG: peptidase M6 immune inhibitor A [Sporichthyaceae bacterium]